MRPEKNRRPVAVILGTRPEIIKLSPLIRLLEREGRNYVLVHTGQHYSFTMDQQFFLELELPQPKYKLARPSSLGANQHAELVLWMRKSIYEILARENPGTVLVQGDTDTVLAGAQAAAQLDGVRIGHVEAGLRSRDLTMPEERNRIEADKLSHLLFAPTEPARQNLLKEGFEKEKISVTGNTIVDALFQNLEIAKKKFPPRSGEKYGLVTIHRPETVDNLTHLRSVLEALEKIREMTSLNFVFSVHPRTRQRLVEIGVLGRKSDYRGVNFTEPMSFLEFIAFENGAELIVTDSGGVQEEACILKVPCVTVRTSTERPETVDAGANEVAGYESDNIVKSALKMIAKNRDWANPFGDGKASERILDILEREEVHA